MDGLLQGAPPRSAFAQAAQTRTTTFGHRPVSFRHDPFEFSDASACDSTSVDSVRLIENAKRRPLSKTFQRAREEQARARAEVEDIDPSQTQPPPHLVEQARGSARASFTTSLRRRALEQPSDGVAEGGTEKEGGAQDGEDDDQRASPKRKLNNKASAAAQRPKKRRIVIPPPPPSPASSASGPPPPSAATASPPPTFSPTLAFASATSAPRAQPAQLPARTAPSASAFSLPTSPTPPAAPVAEAQLPKPSRARAGTPERPTSSRFLLATPSPSRKPQPVSAVTDNVTPPHSVHHLLRKPSPASAPARPLVSQSKRLSLSMQNELSRFRATKDKRLKAFQAEVEKGLTPFRGKKLFSDEFDELATASADSVPPEATSSPTSGNDTGNNGDVPLVIGSAASAPAVE